MNLADATVSGDRVRFAGFEPAGAPLWDRRKCVTVGIRPPAVTVDGRMCVSDWSEMRVRRG